MFNGSYDVYKTPVKMTYSYVKLIPLVQRSLKRQDVQQCVILGESFSRNT